MSDDNLSCAPDPILERLCRLAEDHPDLRPAAAFYRTVLPVLRDADLHAVPVSLTAEEASARLQKGLPLLHGFELELDGSAMGKLILQLMDASEAFGRTPRNPDPAAVMAVAAGQEGALSSAAEALQLDQELVRMLAQNAMKPALRAWRLQLAGLTDGTGWDKGACFICGSAPLLAELQGNNQSKHLRCGECGADWAYRRLQCTYCGNEDHRTLGYLYSGGGSMEPRIEICDKCGGYLKVIHAFAPTPPELLAVEDLATLHLDYMARELGYERPDAGGNPGTAGTKNVPPLL